MLNSVYSQEVYHLLYGLICTYDQTWRVDPVRGRTTIGATAPAPVLVTTLH